MIAIGIVLFLIGYFTGTSLLTTLGIVLVVVGALFLVLGLAGHPVGGRQYWF